MRQGHALELPSEFRQAQDQRMGEFSGEIEDSDELMVSLKVQTREIAISIRNGMTGLL